MKTLSSFLLKKKNPNNWMRFDSIMQYAKSFLSPKEIIVPKVNKIEHKKYLDMLSKYNKINHKKYLDMMSKYNK